MMTDPKPADRKPENVIAVDFARKEEERTRKRIIQKILEAAKRIQW